MAHILILYGTTEGQTQKIATFMAERIRGRGHTVELANSDAFQGTLSAGDFNAAMIGGSLHAGRHQASIARFVKEHQAALDAMPTAFFSVSLTAALDDPEHQAEARKCVDDFLDETGWTPDMVETVAGALPYSQYNLVKRLLMKWISWRNGGPTDTSRDYELTDWEQVGQFVDHFLQHLASSERQVSPSQPEAHS